MKHLIITLVMGFFSTFAYAGETECDFLTESIFVCYFDGTSGLEIFETLDESQIQNQEIAEDGSIVTEVSTPKLHGYDFDIKNCVSEALDNEVTATCFLNNADSKLGFSTARPVPQKTSTAREVPQATSTARIVSQKMVIKRMDRR